MSAHGDEPVPLGGEARQILDAGRAAERLSPRRKAQMRARVMATVAAGAAGVIGATGAASAGSGATSAVGGAASVSAGVAGAAGAAGAAETAGIAGAAGIAKAAGLSLFAKIGLAVAVTTIGAGGWMWSRANQPSPSAQLAASQQAAAPLDDLADSPGTEAPTAVAPPAEVAVSAGAGGMAPAATSTAPFPSDPVGASSAPEAPVGASAGAHASAPAPGSAAAAPAATAEPSGAASAQAVSADSLPEETKLLAAAHAELSRGNAAGALALLDQHAAKFPRGALAPERRAARAMALCKMGRAGDGRSEADALYGPGSKSPLAEKIRRACAK